MFIEKIKNAIYRNEFLINIVGPFYKLLKTKSNFHSSKYWDNRYKKGKNSGNGSYGLSAEHKADIINKFVKEHHIDSTIELGCGDGNQLSMLKIPNYIGLDVSQESIKMCAEQFKKDKNKSFFVYSSKHFIDNHNIFQADLTLSLEVILHLIEDDVYEDYMKDLFAMSKKYVMIYELDTDDQQKFQAQHFKFRKYTDWIEKNIKGWKLVSKSRKEPKSENKNINEDGSYKDFCVYKKT
jgi:hypothetical protein